MPSEPDNSELEARLRELAPMVEAMHATEGQLPPEKRELLLTQIAEGAAKRGFQKYHEGLWESLALAIAQVPLEFRKEWAKLPELLDDIRPVRPMPIYACASRIGEEVLMKTSLSSPQMPEGLMKDLRQRLARSVQLEDVLGVVLERLPELLKNTPDAQQRWEALCTEPVEGEPERGAQGIGGQGPIAPADSSELPLKKIPGLLYCPSNGVDPMLIKMDVDGKGLILEISANGIWFDGVTSANSHPFEGGLGPLQRRRRVTLSAIEGGLGKLLQAQKDAEGFWKGSVLGGKKQIVEIIEKIEVNVAKAQATHYKLSQLWKRIREIEKQLPKYYAGDPKRLSLHDELVSLSRELADECRVIEKVCEKDIPTGPETYRGRRHTSGGPSKETSGECRNPRTGKPLTPVSVTDEGGNIICTIYLDLNQPNEVVDGKNSYKAVYLDKDELLHLLHLGPKGPQLVREVRRETAP